MSRIERAALAIAVASAAATAALSFVPGLRFAYRSDAAHVTLESASAVIAVVAAVLVAGRFRRSRAIRDLLLAFGIAILAGTNLAFIVVPNLDAGGQTVFSTWGRLVAAPLGLGCLAAAAFAPTRALDLRSGLRSLQLGPLLLIAAIAAALLVVDPALPSPLEPGASPEASRSPRLDGPLGVTLVQLGAALLCAAAAAGFARRSRRDGDELLGWLSIAMVLAAFSRLNYALYPSLFSEWVYTGDVFRLGFYLAVLVGSLREIAGYQPRLVEAAVLEDRRRIARDLHDGMAQEIAFILGLVKTKGEEEGFDRDLHAVREAAERALSESREAISALSRPGDEPLHVLLGDTARPLAARAGARLRLELPADVTAPPETAEAFVRITREALANATRHGGAGEIGIRLWSDGDLHLSIADDGTGFDPGPDDGGMGLRNMRERAEALGGRLQLTTAPGRGTVVQVSVPQMSR